MRALICGGRTFGKLSRGKDGNPIRTDERAAEYRFAMDWLQEFFVDYLMDPEHAEKVYGELTIIEGGATGADTIAADFAVVEWLNWEQYKADWDTYGKAAGYLRNIQMLEKGKPDLVVAFPGGKGTAMMVDLARKAGIEVIEVKYDR